MVNENLDNLAKKIYKQSVEYGFRSSDYVKLMNELLELSIESPDVSDNYFVEDTSEIVREIEFPPEYTLAGLTILNYFSEIVKVKYPNIPVKITIQQQKNKVKMIIETPEGKTEEIEKALQEYGLIVQGVMPPEKILQNEYDVLELKQQLRIALMQIEHKKELLKIAENKFENAIQNIEYLQFQQEKLQNLIGDVLLAKKDESTEIVKLLKESVQGNNHALNTAINQLSNLIDRGLNDDNVEEIKNSLRIIQENDPNLFVKIQEFIFGALTSTTGSFLYGALRSLTG